MKTKLFAMSKVVILGVLMSVGFGHGALAMPPCKEKPDFSQLAKSIELDDGVQAEFVQIMEEQHEKRRLVHESVRDRGKSLRDEAREQMLMLKEETEEKLRSILSSDQLIALQSKLPKPPARDHKCVGKSDEKENL